MFRGVLSVRGTGEYRHGIDRYAHLELRSQSRSPTSSVTAAACTFSSCRTAHATGLGCVLPVSLGKRPARSRSVRVYPALSLSEALRRRRDGRTGVPPLGTLDPSVAKKAEEASCKSCPATTPLRGRWRESGSVQSGTGLGNPLYCALLLARLERPIVPSHWYRGLLQRVDAPETL